MRCTCDILVGSDSVDITLTTWLSCHAVTVRLPDCLVTLSPLFRLLGVFLHVLWIAFPVRTESAASVQAISLQVQAEIHTTEEIVTVDVMVPVCEKIQVSS